MKDKIRELLGIGLSPVVVASAVGCTESNISQLLADEVFAQEVQQLKLMNLTETAHRDRKWDTLEDQLLERLEGILPLLARPLEVINALKMVNGAKRRATSSEIGSSSVSPQTLHLHLPNAIAAKFIVNAQNQVVDIEGRTIATMPAKEVMKRLTNRTGQELPSALHQETVTKDIEKAINRLDAITIQKIKQLPVASIVDSL